MCNVLSYNAWRYALIHYNRFTPKVQSDLMCLSELWAKRYFYLVEKYQKVVGRTVPVDGTFQERSLVSMCTPQLSMCTLQLSMCTLQVCMCTLQLSMCTLQLSMCTLQLCMCTLQLSMCTLQLSMCTLQLSMRTLHMSMCTLQLSMCTLHLSMCTLQLSICTLQLSMCTLQLSICTLQLSMCTLQLSMCTLSVEHVHTSSWACAHFQGSMHTFSGEHVHAPRWACAHPHISMCTPRTLEILNFTFSSPHERWNSSLFPESCHITDAITESALLVYLGQAGSGPATRARPSVMGIFGARKSCIPGPAWNFWGEKFMHLRFSICMVRLSTYILWGEHMYTCTYTSTCAYLQVGMCIPTLQHVSLDLSQLHWSHS